MNWKDLFPKDGRYYETSNGILYCGDSLEILNKFPSERIDLVLTDPPYGVGSNDLIGIDYKDEFYDVDNVSKEFFRR